MKFINKNIKKINKSFNLKKIIKFLKKHYILVLVLFLMIYLIKTNFRENYGGMYSGGEVDVNKCTPKALPKMRFCGNGTEGPKSQAINYIKNLKMQIEYYLKVIKENADKTDDVYEAATKVAISKSDTLNKKWNKDTKKPKDLKNWILEDNGRKEEIQKYLEIKYKNDEDFKKTVENLVKKIKKIGKKFSKFEKDIGEKKFAATVNLLFKMFLGSLTWKTIFEANGIEENGFLYKDKYKENSFIYLKEIIKGFHEIHDNVIKKHSIYKKYKIDDKKNR